MASAGMFLLISWRWVRNVVAVIASTRIAARIFTLSWSVLVKESEIFAPKIVALLRWLTSEVVRTPLAWSCAAWLRSRNSARKIGIWIRIGRHEENGLVPVPLYSAIVSWVRRSRSWPYFFCSSLTLGC